MAAAVVWLGSTGELECDGLCLLSEVMCPKLNSALSLCLPRALICMSIFTHARTNTQTAE